MKSNNRLVVAVTALTLCIRLAECFQPQTPLTTVVRKHHSLLPSCVSCRALHNNHEQKKDVESMDKKTSVGRRSFVGGLSFVSLLTIMSTPQTALAGIDVSGLRTEGQSQGNSAIANQLKAYDGSGASRVQEIKQQSAPAAASSGTVKPAASTSPALMDPKVATNAMRYTEPRMSKVGLAGLTSRYEGQIVGPTSRPLLVSFEFPSDWLQLDKFLGGIQYVDQRNGDKLYLLRATLPEDSSLETVPKQWFGDVIFNPNGSIVKQVGNEVDEYKVSKSQVTTVPGGAPHRRVLLKFFTVTGNGLRVERRGLVDAYQVENDVYMLVTSSNANKFEAKGKERDTVEAIVNSFRLERQ